MTVLNKAIEGYLTQASWIRKMFEAGVELKARFGADNVFDFSLGNPDLPPPENTCAALRAIGEHARQALAFGYCPNAGIPAARREIARQIAEQQQLELQSEHIVLSCGAAGGLNVLFRSVLEPGDEIICPAPYFVEYGFYAANHGGVLIPVPSKPKTFDIDLDTIRHALTPKTRIVLVNSPNNPSGAVYAADSISQLGSLLKAHTEKYGRPVFLVSDEPYRFLVYDNVTVPPILPVYEYSVVIGSFSKSLSLAGERIGYICPSPAMPNVDKLVQGLVLSNRILGFVNAPVIGQLLLLELKGQTVDVAVYEERRAAMAEVLHSAGITFCLPKGAFYFFPEVPGSTDDKEFVECMREVNVLAVPGSGFGCPGYFRLTFCMDADIIRRSAPAFARGVERWLGRCGQS